MAVFQLNDNELSVLMREVSEELHRRTKQQTLNVDLGQQIKGLEMGKRAMLVAAAAGQSILLMGSSGSGKTMLRAYGYQLGVKVSFEAHPCLCGYRGSLTNPCTCSFDSLGAYYLGVPKSDLFIEVCPATQREMETKLKGTSVETYQKQIKEAKKHTSLQLDQPSESLLKAAVVELGLSNRDRERILVTARAIANLGWCEQIEASHIAEAVNYRPPNFLCGVKK